MDPTEKRGRLHTFLIFLNGFRIIAFTVIWRPFVYFFSSKSTITILTNSFFSIFAGMTSYNRQLSVSIKLDCIWMA